MGSFTLRYKPSVNYPEQPLSPQNMTHGVMIIDDYSSRRGSILQALSGCYSWLVVIHGFLSFSGLNGLATRSTAAFSKQRKHPSWHTFRIVHCKLLGMIKIVCGSINDTINKKIPRY
ncbi:TPA: hypothetical protein ACOJQP_002683 [Vibrio harveyi]|uniref:hypothetical protein n=1 Tax=Vibrio harveyi TaxID=669 RepID=UPI00390A8158